MRSWLLPEYVEDLLPPEAEQIECLRRQMLDTLRGAGYRLIVPPLLEYVDSLLTDTGDEMALKTCQLVDQLSGRSMGIRADITPQAARIDAHLLNAAGVTRLCYAASVVHARPSGLMGNREPLQLGAELFGHAGVESDIEILQLLLQTLSIAVPDRFTLDIGHVGVFHALVEAGQLSDALANDLFAALQSKDQSALQQLTQAIAEPSIAQALQRLPELYGESNSVLQQARAQLPNLAKISVALDNLAAIVAGLTAYSRKISLDLGELRGYHYHTGVVFSAYARGCPNAIARGGRYDAIGKIFGRARPATGFSLDLRELVKLAPAQSEPNAWYAPYAPDDPALQQFVKRLRAQGEIVITALPQAPAPSERFLQQSATGEWQLPSTAA